MEDAKSFEHKLARIFEVTGAASDSALAKILGIKAPSVAAARKRRQIPSGWVEQVAEEFRASANWLFFGEGPKLIDEIFPPVPREVLDSGKHKIVPVAGMASCNIKGWYNESPLAVTTPLPIPDASDEIFAVLAIGYSMVPAGIRPGYVVFCDPCVKPSIGDMLFIERMDGKVSIKRLKEQAGDWLTIEGWLDPDDGGNQKPYSEQVHVRDVRRIACVIFIKVKA